MEVSCLEDTEVEEYVDELEGFAESFSDEDHVEEEGVYSDEMNINIAEIDVEESAGPYANNSMVRAPAAPVQTTGRKHFT
ncbi:Nucleoside triphosphate pyrophosphatase [Trichinella spiralis]|uniref:Nucleoside triphosphate pyrophosphatase n=1 Tax=Trichinella spiralis TaxID=6334 RepID=A0ABR3KA56_TRISP